MLKLFTALECHFSASIHQLQISSLDCNDSLPQSFTRIPTLRLKLSRSCLLSRSLDLSVSLILWTGGVIIYSQALSCMISRCCCVMSYVQLYELCRRKKHSVQWLAASCSAWRHWKALVSRELTMEAMLTRIVLALAALLFYLHRARNWCTILDPWDRV